MAKERGKLLVISGPSAGVGKDTIREMFLKNHPYWVQPPSTTTRSPRPGEIADKDMSFVTRDQFEQWQKAGKFLETDFHASHWYGTLHGPVEKALSSGRNVLLRIDVNGALQVKKRLPEAVLIFINAETTKALETRIRGRGSETEEQIQERLALAKKELPKARQFDHTVINPTDHPERAVAAIEQILGLKEAA